MSTLEAQHPPDWARAWGLGVVCADWLSGSVGGAGAGLPGTSQEEEQVRGLSTGADSFPPVRQVLLSLFYRQGN